MADHPRDLLQVPGRDIPLSCDTGQHLNPRDVKSGGGQAGLCSGVQGWR